LGVGNSHAAAVEAGSMSNDEVGFLSVARIHFELHYSALGVGYSHSEAVGAKSMSNAE
jgi:hypothetical protein